MLTLRNLFRTSQSIKKGREWGLADDYEVLYPLGKGSSAKVFQGVHVVTGRKVVIKIFKKISPEAIKKEIEVNQKLLDGFRPEVHANVQFIHLLDTLYDHSSSTFTLVYDFHPGVPLNQLITSFTYPQTLKAIFTIAHTLRYIHSAGFIHRDIKPANILFTPTGPRIFDFGLAKAFTEDGLRTNNFGTKSYKCPEVVYRMELYDKGVDVWGLGLIFAELLLNKRHLLHYESDLSMLSQLASFCAMESADKSVIANQFVKHITISRAKSWKKLAEQKNLDESLVELVGKMLQVNPRKRASL
jgi:serine/threonine protein kinase